MYKFLVIILIVGAFVSANGQREFIGTSGNTDESEYRGKVFKEISIDDEGIILIDTAGNEMEIRIDRRGDSEASAQDYRQRVERLVQEQRIAPEDMETIRQVTKIGGSVIVKEDEYVEGDVVVMGGNATIRGWVAGSVQATGKVKITSTGVVEGDVIAPRIIEETGSQVYGRIKKMSIPLDTGEWEEKAGSNVVFLVILGTQLAASIGIVLIFKKPAERVTVVYKSNILKAIIVGFGVDILILPAFILLLITVIGIPVALLALPLALVAAALLGTSSFCLYISDLVNNSRKQQEESRTVRTMIGFFVLQAPAIVMMFGLLINSELIAILFGIIAAIVNFIVLTAAFGSTLLTRLGTRDYSEEDREITVTATVA